MADIDFVNLKFSQSIEYGGEEGVPDLLIYSDIALLCVEHKGHQSDTNITKNMEDDTKRFEKYHRILCPAFISSTFGADVCNSDVSFCYTDNWINTLEDHGKSLEDALFHDDIRGVIWRMYKDHEDVVIQKKFGHHTIPDIESVLSRGLRTSESKINIYSLLDWDEPTTMLLKSLKLALYTLASQGKDEIKLNDIRHALESNDIITANNEQLHQRIITKLNADLSDNNIVEKVSDTDGKWKLSVKFTAPKSKSAWEKRWDAVLSTPQSDLSAPGM